MPKKPVDERPVEQVEEKLVPYLVIIDGRDMTVLAKDADDLQQRIKRIRETMPKA